MAYIRERTYSFLPTTVLGLKKTMHFAVIKHFLKKQNKNKQKGFQFHCPIEQLCGRV